KPGIKDRLTESVRTALKLTGGAVLVAVVDGEEKLYSERMACVLCGINVPPLEPRSFSFNSAYGACKRCHGLGTVLEVDPAKLIPDANTPSDKLEYCAQSVTAFAGRSEEHTSELQSRYHLVCRPHL